MNCPSRTDEPLEGDGYNQNPNALANDLTTREDLNGRANGRALRRSREDEGVESINDLMEDTSDGVRMPREKGVRGGVGGDGVESGGGEDEKNGHVVDHSTTATFQNENRERGRRDYARTCIHVSRDQFVKMKQVLVKFAKFVGPGFMVCDMPLLPTSMSTSISKSNSTTAI